MFASSIECTTKKIIHDGCREETKYDLGSLTNNYIVNQEFVCLFETIHHGLYDKEWTLHYFNHNYWYMIYVVILL